MLRIDSAPLFDGCFPWARGLRTKPTQLEERRCYVAAQEDVRRDAGAMQDDAKAMWNDAADVARSAASRQQQAAAQGIGKFAGALREAARNTDGGDGASARVAETIADGLDRLSGSLKGRDLNALIRDVEDFARSQPLVFLGAAVATGFIAMRFLKSSTPESADYPGDRATGSMAPRTSMSTRDTSTTRDDSFPGSTTAQRSDTAHRRSPDRTGAADQHPAGGGPLDE
jgi:hypothetical protein